MPRTKQGRREAGTRLDFDPSLPLIRELMREYAGQLGIDLRFQDFEAELAQLPGRYAGPEGCLLAAFVNGNSAGCGAYRRIEDTICEMKRLYTRPAFRGHGLGRAIAEALIERARVAGYCSMRLDTLSSMRAAVSLYESLGFRRIAPYNETPLPDCVFFEAIL